MKAHMYSHPLPGFMVRAMTNAEVLTLQEERVLAARAKKGDEKAVHELMERNLRLLVKIAHDFGGLGVDLDDLISEGSIGLRRAAMRFNPKKAKFSTYAGLWIRQAIMRYLSKHGHLIRLPCQWGRQYRKIQRAVVEMAALGLDTPSIAEIAEATGIKPSHVMRFQTAPVSFTSLDEKQDPNEEASSPIGESIADTDAVAPGAALARQNDYAEVEKALGILNPRAREILRRRFGFRTGVEENLEDVGRHFKITRERVRQIQNQSLHAINAHLARRHVIEDRRSLEVKGRNRAQAGQNFVREQKAEAAQSSNILKAKKLHQAQQIRQLDQVFAEAA